MYLFNLSVSCNVPIPALGLPELERRGSGEDHPLPRIEYVLPPSFSSRSTFFLSSIPLYYTPLHISHISLFYAHYFSLSFSAFRLLNTRHVYSHHVICFLKSQSSITFIQFVDQISCDIVPSTFFSEITLFPVMLAFRLIVLRSFNQFQNIQKFLPKLEIQNLKAQPSALTPFHINV